MMASMLWARSPVCEHYMHSAPGPLAHPLQWDWKEDTHF